MILTMLNTSDPILSIWRSILWCPSGPASWWWLPPQTPDHSDRPWSLPGTLYSSSKRKWKFVSCVSWELLDVSVVDILLNEVLQWMSLLIIKVLVIFWLYKNINLKLSYWEMILKKHHLQCKCSVINWVSHRICNVQIEIK